MSISAPNGGSQGPQVPHPEVVVISGKRLTYRLRGKGARVREEVAQDLVNGEAHLARLTCRQAAAIARVSYARLLYTKKPKKNPPTIFVSTVLAWWKSASYAERVTFVRDVGVGDLWDIIEGVIK